MALNLEAKKVIVKEVNEVAKTSVAVGVAKYSGLSVSKMTELRQLANQTQVSLRVVKNTLAKRAFAGTDCECVQHMLSGHILLGFSKQDPGAVARVFHKFSESNSALVVTGLGVTGQFIDITKLKQIATLPTKNEAISLVMALMLAPIEKLTRTLNEVPSKVVRTLATIAKQKQ